MDEMLTTVDSDGRAIGSAPRSLCHDGRSHIAHAVVHLHVVKPSGRILLQKRSENKRIQPGKWDTAVGGHVAAGEQIFSALQRESSEEIGVDASQAQFLLGYMFNSDIETEWVNVFTLEVPEDFAIEVCNEEVDETRFFTAEEIAAMIKSGSVTPNFAMEYSTHLRNGNF